MIGSLMMRDIVPEGHAVEYLATARFGTYAYNAVMDSSNEHSRREFLTGRGMAHAVSGKLQQWADRHVRPLVGSAALHVEAKRRAMACEFAVQYHGADAAAAEPVMEALDLVESLEDQLTIYRDWSEVIEINRHAFERAVEVELQLFGLLELAEQICQRTQETFDITTTPLSRIWGFLRREGRIPTQEEITAAMDRVGFEKVLLDRSRKTIRFLQPSVEINLNSVGKGYALDRAAAYLDERGVKDYLWHGGRSSVLARGRNRADQRGCWTVGLPHPLRPGERLAEFHLRDRALGTSGCGTQFFEYEGNRYSHVIDPRTGWPAVGVLTATVLARTAAEADALATALFVSGPAGTAEYCSSHPEIAAVLLCPAERGDEVTIHSWGLGSEDWRVC